MTLWSLKSVEGEDGKKSYHLKHAPVPVALACLLLGWYLALAALPVLLVYRWLS